MLFASAGPAEVSPGTLPAPAVKCTMPLPVAFSSRTTKQLGKENFNDVVLVQPSGGFSWYLACLLPQSAMSLFAFTLISWEISGFGITTATVLGTVTPSLYFSAGSVIMMLCMDAVIYGALTLAIDNATRAEPLTSLLQVLCRVGACVIGFLRSRAWHDPFGVALVLFGLDCAGVKAVYL